MFIESYASSGLVVAKSQTSHEQNIPCSPTLSGIPIEILRAILESVDGTSKEMLRQAAVSRRWLPLATELAYQRCSVRGRRNLLALFVRMSQPLSPAMKNELYVYGMGDCMMDAVRVEDKHFIIPLCTSLVSLKLALLPDWRWLPSHHIQQLPNIRHFEFEILRKQPSTYTNSTRMMCWWLCVVPKATSMVLKGVQWLAHIAEDFPLPHFQLKQLEMKQCAGERIDLFSALLQAGCCESLDVDESAMPCLLLRFAPNLLHFTFEDSPDRYGKWAPSRTIDMLILQWKRLKSVTLPTSCRDMVLHSDSVQRLELVGPSFASDSPKSLRSVQCLTEDLTTLREIRLPATRTSVDDKLPRMMGALSLQVQSDSPRHMSSEELRFAREMGLRGVRVDYVSSR